ncbi:RbsD/FucU domain-containing protein [Paenibacillus cisolokensis]|uniref:RbsD/FucU family protein n=1 Tax=Paenibacillus TaxID=44249 RepID=UPI000720BA0E|nr:RbsD/FucU domain-containing protein [Paenibacillus sp. 32O-W]ALS28457.1 fucose isomerase [Paenibacillus sp. 32O-W]
MLKGISSLLTPELLKILMEMGHGDDLVIGDGNFPAASHAQRLVRLDGHGVPAVLDAVLSVFPLDQYVERPAGVMAVVPGDPVVPVIWDTYKELVAKHEGKPVEFEEIERFAFYERAKKAYAIVATGESAQYANIILKKGCVL